MTIILEIVAPVFGVMILGYAATWIGLFDKRAQEGVALFVFNVAVPALLFRSLVQRPLSADLPFDYPLAYYLAALGLFAVGMAVNRLLFRRKLAELAIAGMSGSFSNSVLIGLPLILTALGEAASVPVFLLLAFHSLIYFSLTTLLIEVGRSRDAGLSALVSSIVVGFLKNPIVIGLIAGILWGQTGWGLPGAVDSVLELLGRAVAPCALFTMGAALRTYRIAGSLREAGLAVALKLILHPLITFVFVTWIFPMPTLWAQAAVLLAALPTGVNVFIFAERYGVWARRAMSVVALSTALSMVTITILLYLLGVRGGP